MAVAPTLNNTYNSTFTSGTTKTVNVSTQPGDIVVVAGVIENCTFTFGTPTGNSIVFTRNRQDGDGSTATCRTTIWSGTDNTGGTNWTLSLSINSAASFGFTCYVFRNSSGLGVSNGFNQTTTSTALISLTPSANSAIVVMDADWTGGSVPSHTWSTANTYTGSDTITYGSSSYVVYSGFYPGTGSGGAANYGLSSPSQRYTISALEILGGTASLGATTAWLGA